MSVLPCAQRKNSAFVIAFSPALFLLRCSLVQKRVETSLVFSCAELQKSLGGNIDAFPTEEDLKGAAVAVLRLQDVYKVNTSSMSRGLAGAQGERLTLEDCYLLGRSAYNSNDWRNTKVRD